MILFLTSSPCLYQHAPATLNPANGFLRRLRAALSPKPRTLFVASSPEDEKMTAFFCADMAGAFARAGFDLEPYTILDRTTAPQAQKLVPQADFVILMGGHVPTQNAFFAELDLRELLQNFEGVLMGISAGSMNAAGEVYAQPEEPGESSPAFQRFYRGLGLTDIHICPHYQQVYNMVVDGRSLYGEITPADSMGRTFHVFPDGTYLYRDEQEYAIFGECLRMKDGILEKLTEDGGVIPLSERP